MFEDIFPPERKERLESIYRYPTFDHVMYRSNLWRHTQRVSWIIEALAPLIKKYTHCDAEKARTIALIHDDPEMITGDISSYIKNTSADGAKIYSDEMDAIEILSKKYPKEINGYSYKELLLSTMSKDTIEAQIASYADKLDAYCESLHEVYAGNISLIRGIMFYANAIALFPVKFPALKELLSSKESPLTYTTEQISAEGIKIKDFALLNKPHTKESLLVNTDFTFYKEWKRIVMEKGHTDWLITQKEFNE